MADFTAKDVQRLRQTSGVGMMDAKRALSENDGDFEAASRWLREKGLAKASERGDRVSSQGGVSIAEDGASAAVVALLSETDFVAKSPDFTSLLDALAKAVAARGEDAVAERQDELDNMRITLKENIQLGTVHRFVAPDGAVIDAYLHVQNGRGVNGVLVELQGGDKALAHEVALHVASQRPQWLTRDEVPPERVAEERQIVETLTRNEGKPEAAVPKIVEGRLNNFFKENCLLEQVWVKDQKQTIAELLGDATVNRYAQVEIGR